MLCISSLRALNLWPRPAWPSASLGSSARCPHTSSAAGRCALAWSAAALAPPKSLLEGRFEAQAWRVKSRMAWNLSPAAYIAPYILYMMLYILYICVLVYIYISLSLSNHPISCYSLLARTPTSSGAPCRASSPLIQHFKLAMALRLLEPAWIIVVLLITSSRPQNATRFLLFEAISLCTAASMAGLRVLKSTPGCAEVS